MEKTETDFSEITGPEKNSHKLLQGTFHAHMGKMGKQMSQWEGHVLQPGTRQDVASPILEICDTSQDKVPGNLGIPVELWNQLWFEQEIGLHD